MKKKSDSLDAEILRGQPGIVNLQHQPGIVLGGHANLGGGKKVVISLSSI